jgi:membrane protein
MTPRQAPRRDAAADLATSLRFGQLFSLLRAAAAAWLEDDGGTMGAAIAFYTLFSLAPLLVIVLAVAGLLFGHDAAQGRVIGQLQELIGYEGAKAIQGMLQGASDPARSAGAALVGALTFVLGATTVFAELQADLIRIWREPEIKKSWSVMHLLRDRILSFGMILGIGFLMIVSLILSAALSAFTDWWGSYVTLWPVLLETVNATTTFAIIMLAFAMIYRFLPRSRISWRDVWMGSAVTALLFTIGKLLIGIYLGSTRIGTAYGGASSLVLLLVWVYYSAQIFLLGAEFTWVFAYRYGSRSHERPPERPGARQAQPRASKP